MAIDDRAGPPPTHLSLTTRPATQSDTQVQLELDTPNNCYLQKKVLEKVQECVTMCKKHDHNTQVQLKHDMRGQAIAKKLSCREF